MALEVQEGAPCIKQGQSIDMPHDNVMVTGRAYGLDGAIAVGQSISQVRDVVYSYTGRNGSEQRCLGTAQRKAAAQLFLILCQDADGEKPRALNHFKRARAVVRAEQHQGRVQRDGGERVYRHSVKSIMTAADNDSNAGCELCQRFAE
jgi:hypothetical protein